MLLAYRGNYDEARELVQASTQIVSELGHAYGAATMMIFAATLEGLAGEVGESRDSSAARRVAGLRPDRHRRPRRRGGPRPDTADARSRRRAGGRQPDRPADAARRGICNAAAAPSEAADLLGIHARIEAEQGHPEQARALAEQAVTHAGRTDSPLSRGIAELDRAQVLAAGGDGDRSLDRQRSPRCAGSSRRDIWPEYGWPPGWPVMPVIGTLNPAAKLTWGLPARSCRRSGRRRAAVLGALTPEQAWGGSTGGDPRLRGGLRHRARPSGRRAGGRSWAGYGGGRPEVVESEAGDACGHGTACASIIRRIAPDCELYSVRSWESASPAPATCCWPGCDGRSPRLRRDQHEPVDHPAAVRPGIARDGRRCLLPRQRDRRLGAQLAGGELPVAVRLGHLGRLPSQESDPELYLYNPQPPVEFFAPGRTFRSAGSTDATIRTTGNSFATPLIAGCARDPGQTPE